LLTSLVLPGPALAQPAAPPPAAAVEGADPATADALPVAPTLAPGSMPGHLPPSLGPAPGPVTGLLQQESPVQQLDLLLDRLAVLEVERDAAVGEVRRGLLWFALAVGASGIGLAAGSGEGAAFPLSVSWVACAAMGLAGIPLVLQGQERFRQAEAELREVDRLLELPAPAR